MTGLLDTHVFLWSINDPSRISPNASAFLRDPKNQLLLSVASVWEIAIKVRSGKLITAWPVTAIPTLLMASRIDLLDIRMNHAIMAGSFRTRTKTHSTACWPHNL